MASSEFAKRQLRKHGWTEGSGLGKEEDGRAEPIKVSLKMDKSGVGHDPGKEFTDHWWLRVFNEAAQKIGKADKKNSAKIETDEEKAKIKKEKQRKNFYKGFVQSATLTNGVEEKNNTSDSSSEDEKEQAKAVSVPTLEDIHKFCGGATGHKAASFGFRLGGKVDRANHHEKTFEEQLKKERSTNIVADDNVLKSEFFVEEADKSKKVKKRKEKNAENRKCDEENSGDHFTDAQKEHCLDESAQVSNCESGVEVKMKKKRKKKKNREITRDRDHFEPVSSEIQISTKRKQEELLLNESRSSENGPSKKRKKYKEDSANANGNVEEGNDDVLSKKEKKRKKKVKGEKIEDIVEAVVVERDACKKKKKKKKKHKDKL